MNAKPNVSPDRVDQLRRESQQLQPALAAEMPAVREEWKQRVFKLEPDYDARANSPWHWLNSDADVNAWDFLDSTIPQAAHWSPLPVKLEQEKKCGDFFYLTAGGGFVASAKAISIIAPVLSGTAEFLPVACDQIDDLFVIHSLRHIGMGQNAQTNQTSPHENVTVVYDYDFRLHEVRGLHLFMVRQPVGCPAGDNGSALSGMFASPEFKRVIESSRLRGLSFREFPVV